MSKKATRQDRIVEHLKSQGCMVCPSRSRKFVKLERNGHPGEFYFVGKGGGVRAGANLTSSISLTWQFSHVK